jgi:hypothetical protein
VCHVLRTDSEQFGEFRRRNSNPTAKPDVGEFVGTYPCVDSRWLNLQNSGCLVDGDGRWDWYVLAHVGRILAALNTLSNMSRGIAYYVECC